MLPSSFSLIIFNPPASNRTLLRLRGGWLGAAAPAADRAHAVRASAGATHADTARDAAAGPLAYTEPADAGAPGGGDAASAGRAAALAADPGAGRSNRGGHQWRPGAPVGRSVSGTPRKVQGTAVRRDRGRLTPRSPGWRVRGLARGVQAEGRGGCRLYAGPTRGVFGADGGDDGGPPCDGGGPRGGCGALPFGNSTHRLRFSPGAEWDRRRPRCHRLRPAGRSITLTAGDKASPGDASPGQGVQEV